MANGLIQEEAEQASQGSQQASSQAPQGQEFQVSPEAQKIIDRAIEILYSPGEGNLENMVQMFNDYGPSRMPEAMATAILGLLERLQKESEMSLQLLSEVGAKLYEIVLQDMMDGGIIKDLNEAQALKAMRLILEGWVRANPNTLNPQEMQEVQGIIQSLAQSEQKSSQEPIGATGGSAGPPSVGGM